MTRLELDWSTAEVSDGKLTVSLDDRPDEAWVASFERTAQLLDHGTWPAVKVKKREISVKSIEPGTEERLRFFLESVIQEANAEQGLDEEEPTSEGEQTDESPETTENRTDPDAEMTDRFRSFSTEQGAGGGSSGDS